MSKKEEEFKVHLDPDVEKLLIDGAARAGVTPEKLLVMQLDNQRLTKETLELTAKLAAPRSSSYKGMQTELRVAIHNLEGTNAALRADRDHLQKRLQSTIKNLQGHARKIKALEATVDNFKAREMVGQMWESELREVLGIAGPHTKGVKIINTVKSILAAKSWQHYEPEIRKMERERIFRKLTALGDLASGGFIGLHVHDKNYQIKYTEQQMSDFLKEE